MSREKLVSKKHNPLLAPLPDWVEGFRSLQVEAVTYVNEAFKAGKQCVVVDAPTGVGKTLIARTVQLMLGVPAMYVCSSLALQDQFVKDFPTAKIIKGRRNYRTELGAWDSERPYESVSCEECTWTKKTRSCRWCSSKSRCPYEIAKEEACRSQLAVANISYALTEWNGPGWMSGRELVILDEADLLERALMEYVGLSISPRTMARYSWDCPKVTVREDWEKWIEERVPEVKKRVRAIEERGETGREVAKERRYLVGLGEKLESVRAGIEGGREEWVFTGRDGEVAWKPVRVDKCGEAWWGHGKRFLLMSATVISPSHLLASTGFTGSWSSIALPSPFPVENRKVVVRSVANLSRASSDADRRRIVDAVAKILRESGSNERVLVHTVSYALAREISKGLRERGEECRRPIYTQESAGDRGPLLRKFRATPGSVLLSPSLDRGVDLPGEDCRTQIIVKVPFPNLGDRQVSSRVYGGGSEGRAWYLVETIRGIVQMTGRAVRGEEDWARTYILDGQFRERVWGKGRELFPKWWREALVWER